MKVLAVYIAVVGAMTAGGAIAGAPPVGAFAPSQPLSERELANLRGGFLLPNGLDVAIGIDVQTYVNGQLALHTVAYTDPGPGQGLRVLVGDGASVESSPAVTVTPQAAQAPELIIDRRGAGTTLVPARAQTPATTVHVTSAPREVWPVFSGEKQLDVTPGGPSVSTSLGNVKVDETATGTVVTLSNDNLLVKHLLGQAAGTVIANTADNRAIDSTYAVNVDLRGSWPSLTQSMFAVSAVAVDAARGN